MQKASSRKTVLTKNSSFNLINGQPLETTFTVTPRGTHGAEHITAVFYLK
jgi:hypothetical protein